MKSLSIFIISGVLVMALGWQSKTQPATKKISAPADSLYFIQGTKQDFQLLYMSIADPDNVTVNQKKALAGWVAGARYIPIDTTKKK